MDVCLVNMPIAAVQRPSLALGLLSAVLERDGISTKVLYPDLWFAEYFGLRLYRQLYQGRPDDLLTEWLFAGTAFPDFEPDHDHFFERLFARNPGLGRSILYREEGTEAFKATMLEGREKASDFIDWVVREVLAFAPRIVGCTSMFQQHVAALALLRRLRESDPSVATMMGGPNCETTMGKTTHQTFPWVDFLVSGEADSFIAPLCREILDRGREADPGHLSDGIFTPAHRETGYPFSAHSIDGLPRATSSSLEGLPPPDYDDYFEELSGSLLKNWITPNLLIEASRGCWWGEKHHCTFCGLNGEGMVYRSKSADQVHGEIDTLVKKYKITNIEAVDNILRTDYFTTLLPKLEDSPEDYLFFFETKSNLKRAQIQQLWRSGARYIQPGIESLDSRVLKLMRKGAQAWQNVQLLKDCRQNGIWVFWSMIVGFPGEEDEWYAKMAEIIPLLTHLQPGGFIGLRYDRFSPYVNDPGAFGLELTPSELYPYVYPLSEEEIANQAYFFIEKDKPSLFTTLTQTPILGRPGIEAARDAFRKWRRTWPEAELCSREVDGEIQLRDTRPCANRLIHRLSGTDRLVLEACDTAPTQAKLLQTLAKDATPEDITEALARLIDNKFILKLDGRLVSLVLDEPMESLPSEKLLPFGAVIPPQSIPQKDDEDEDQSRKVA